MKAMAAAMDETRTIREKRREASMLEVRGWKLELTVRSKQERLLRIGLAVKPAKTSVFLDRRIMERDLSLQGRCLVHWKAHVKAKRQRMLATNCLVFRHF